MNLNTQLAEALRSAPAPRRADQWPTHRARARRRRRDRRPRLIEATT